MQLYGIRRRTAWATPADLEAAGARSTEEGDKEGSGVRWIRTYVLAEENGELGSFCVYEADSPEAIRAGAVPQPAHRRHARPPHPAQARLPVARRGRPPRARARPRRLN